MFVFEKRIFFEKQIVLLTDRYIEPRARTLQRQCPVRASQCGCRPGAAQAQGPQAPRRAPHHPPGHSARPSAAQPAAAHGTYVSSLCHIYMYCSPPPQKGLFLMKDCFELTVKINHTGTKILYKNPVIVKPAIYYCYTISIYKDSACNILLLCICFFLHVEEIGP